MNEYELIDTAKGGLNAAEAALNKYNLDSYAEHMNTVLNLLIEELVGLPPKVPGKPQGNFNPEQILEEIAIAIKHRTISTRERWNIVYHHDRLTCVPSYYYIPEQIILHEFTERMVQRGFTTTYWHQLKMNVIKLYKELEPCKPNSKL